MPNRRWSRELDKLLQREDWEGARNLLEVERKKDPENHWLLTQLGVTFYEQKKYQEALRFFLEARDIVPDCPLTVWNLAGTLDALGKQSAAVRLYTWLLESETSFREDPCWESKEWTEALKADTVYRLGVCFQNLGRRRAAEHCFRQYLNLLLAGIKGMYSADEVTRQIRELHTAHNGQTTEGELHKAVKATLQASGIEPKGRQSPPPKLRKKKMLAGERSARKK